MNIQSLFRLPWRIKNVVRAMRRDLADSRNAMADNRIAMDEILKSIASLKYENRAMTEELSALREELLGEIREQGLLLETAARLATRAAAESKLRAQLTPPTLREPGVSILIACWNHAGFLRHSVASTLAALDLLPVPGEVLILDDASRDGSREAAQELARVDQRVRLIESVDNLGLPCARNVLLSQARYEHAMILDADNQLVPSGVAILHDAARQTGSVLTYGNILKVDQHGSVLELVSNERATADLLHRNWIDAMALVRTERLLELGGYDCQWLYGMEDWELNQRLFSLGEPMTFVPVHAGNYTVLPLSMLREAPTSLRHRRGGRIFGCVAPADLERHRACVFHPAIGTIWTSNSWSSTASEPPLLAVSQPATSRLQVLVVSSGGVRNYGDDAILLSTLERLRRIRPDCVAAVVTDGPNCPPLGRLGVWAGTSEEFGTGLDPDDVRLGFWDDQALNAELSRWLKPGSHARSCLDTFDVVIMAGGGNLNCYWPNLIAWRAAIAAGANAVGVPYILSGQGVGPISEEIIPMLSFLVAGALAVATRDPQSVRLLRQLEPTQPRMSMVGDDALGLRCDGPIVARGRLAEIGVPQDRRLLGFQVARPIMLASRAKSSVRPPGVSMLSPRTTITSSSACPSTCRRTAAPRSSCSPTWPTAVLAAPSGTSSIMPAMSPRLPG